MLRVPLDDYVADGTAQRARYTTAENDVDGAHLDAGQRSSGELHVSQVLAILRRRIFLILAIAGVGTVLATMVALLIPPKYRAIAQLVVEAPTLRAGERVLGVAQMDERIDTYVTLLSSRDHLQHVVDSLLNDPKFQQIVRNAVGVEPAAGSRDGVPQSAALHEPTGAMTVLNSGLHDLKRRLGVWLGGFGRSKSAAETLLEEFERNTKVLRERRSRVVSVVFTSTSPEKAAASANRIVQLYVDRATEQKRADAIHELAQLDKQIAEAKEQAEEAKIAVQEAIQKLQDSKQNATNGERVSDWQLRELLGQVGATAQHYDGLVRRQKEIREQPKALPSDLGMQLLADVPKRPSSHNPILFIFPAFIIFVIGGSWLAVVLEKMDRGLRSQEESSDALGVSCIGLVPLLPRRHAVRPALHLLKKPWSAYAEAIRSAVATLRLAGPAGPSKVVLITSSMPREGKTTLALSLAAYVSLLGKRVLLIDLGFRQRAHLGAAKCTTETTETGVVDLPLPNRPPAELIRHLRETGVDYLPMASHRLDPLTFFASEQMLGFVRQMRERYDCVIIDGPPVLGAAEARLLPSLVDRLLLVVRWGRTRREIARNAMILLRDSGCLKEGRSDFAASILTQVDLKRHARYRYGDVGEFLSSHKQYYSRPPRSRGETGDNEPAAEN